MNPLFFDIISLQIAYSLKISIIYISGNLNIELIV